MNESKESVACRTPFQELLKEVVQAEGKRCIREKESSGSSETVLSEGTS
jgi:hypothetical protein